MARPGSFFEAWRDQQFRRDLLSNVPGAITGAGEAALTFGTGMLAEPVAGLTGILAATRPGFNAADAVESVREKLTYQPRTEGGKRVLGLVGQGVEAVADAIPDEAKDAWYAASARAPALAAGGVALASLLGPRGARAPAPKPRLKGLPEGATIKGVGRVAQEPVQAARDAADSYRARMGGSRASDEYVTVHPAAGRRVAQAFEEMQHAPDDPRVRASYDAMIDETLAQWREIEKTGLKVEFIKPGQPDPYAASPRLAIEDIRNNNHLWVFPTDSGFGSDAAFDASRNPLLRMTDVEVDGRRLRANDVFRIVHDYFGHAKEGTGFRADGEENAWRQHMAMYSPLARGAMTSETRGQNSWVNWGPKAEQNRGASGADTFYADQKIGLLPYEFWAPEAAGLKVSGPPRQRGLLLAEAAPAAARSPTAVVNIGLKAGRGGEDIPVEAAVSALRSRGIPITRRRVDTGGEEPALVAELGRPLTKQEADEVSRELKQMAISQRVNGVGEILGPQADEWGAFDAGLFRDFSGEPIRSPGDRQRGSVRVMNPAGADGSEAAGLLGGKPVPDAAPKRKRPMRQTVANPQRNLYPKIYAEPGELVARAGARFVPEDPLLKQLWGVTRDDLYEMSLRSGNQPGVIPGAAKRPQVIEHAENVKTPANERRITNAIEALRTQRPDMFRAFHAWYVMDPMFRRLVELVGPEEAMIRHTRMNLLSAMESPNMAVPHEIVRGTAANMMHEQGRMADWMREGGLKASQRTVEGLESVPGRIGGSDIAKRQARLIEQVKDGVLTPELISELAHKTGLYGQASGTPETGFQTDIFVGDAHKVRSMGLADTRPATDKSDPGRSITKAELQSLAPWHRALMAKLGIEPVPGQAIEWNLFGDATGVKSPLGPSKLEIKSKLIGKTAKRLGVSPETARDMVLLGRAHAGFVDPKLAAGLLVGGGGLLGLASLFGDSKEDAKKKDEKRKSKTQRALEEMGE